MSVITAGRARTGATGTKPAELPRKSGPKPAERKTRPAPRRNGLSGRSRVTRTTSRPTPAAARPKVQPATRTSGAARMPFVLLIVGLLSAGLITLLLLNTATASGSFTESALSDRNAELTLQQQELERTVGALNTPDGLAAAAARLGMVPGGDPVFLVIKPDGSSKIVGTPAPATAPPAPPPPPPSNPPANSDQNESQNHDSQHDQGQPAHRQQAQNHSPNQNQTQSQTQNQGQNHTQDQNQTQDQTQNHGQHQPAGTGPQHQPQDDR